MLNQDDGTQLKKIANLCTDRLFSSIAYLTQYAFSDLEIGLNKPMSSKH